MQAIKVELYCFGFTSNWLLNGGHGRIGYEKGNVEIWLSVKVKYLLADGLHQFLSKIKYVPSSEKGPTPYFQKNLGAMLAQNMDSTRRYLEQYYPEITSSYGTSIYDFAGEYWSWGWRATLSSEWLYFGEMIFKDSLVTFFDGDQGKETYSRRPELLSLTLR